MEDAVQEKIGVPQLYSTLPFGYRATEYSWPDRRDFWVEICDVRRNLVSTVIIKKEYPFAVRDVIVKMHIRVHEREQREESQSYEAMVA